MIEKEQLYLTDQVIIPNQKLLTKGQIEFYNKLSNKWRGLIIGKFNSKFGKTSRRKMWDIFSGKVIADPDESVFLSKLIQDIMDSQSK